MSGCLRRHFGPCFRHFKTLSAQSKSLTGRLSAPNCNKIFTTFCQVISVISFDSIRPPDEEDFTAPATLTAQGERLATFKLIHSSSYPAPFDESLSPLCLPALHLSSLSGRKKTLRGRRKLLRLTPIVGSLARSTSTRWNNVTLCSTWINVDSGGRRPLGQTSIDHVWRVK